MTASLHREPVPDHVPERDEYLRLPAEGLDHYVPTFVPPEVDNIGDINQHVTNVIKTITRSIQLTHQGASCVVEELECRFSHLGSNGRASRRARWSAFGCGAFGVKTGEGREQAHVVVLSYPPWNLTEQVLDQMLDSKLV